MLTTRQLKSASHNQALMITTVLPFEMAKSKLVDSESILTCNCT